MASFSAVVLLVTVLALGARGEEDTISHAVEAVNETSSLPPPPHPVVLFLVKLLIKDTPGNESQGNVTYPERPGSELLEVPKTEETENASNSVEKLKRMAEETHKRVRRFADSEARLVRRKRTFSKHKGLCGSICGLIPQIIMQPMHYQPQHQQPQSCNICQQQPHQPHQHHPPPPPPPPPPQYCDPCHQNQNYQQPPPQQYYPSPCGGGGGGCGGGGSPGGSCSQSSATSSAQSSSGTWGKKK